jgi:hypothetical protein
MAFAVRCISDGGPGLSQAHFGWLARFEDGALFFVGERRRNRLAVEIPLAGASIERESRFLSEKLYVRPARGKAYEFAFERGHSRLADEAARKLAEPERKELEAAVAI